MIPQILYLSLIMLSLGINIAKHGQPRKPGTENAWHTLVGAAISLTIMYYGGFFAVFGLMP